MPHKAPVILRADAIARAELPMTQRLNPQSKFYGSWLSRIAGLERVGFSQARIPARSESFAYHAHLGEEECVYIVSGRAVLRADDQEYALAAGDFAAFPAPQAAHVLRNPYDEDCVYLMAGERGPASDVLAYPDLGKSYVLVRGAAGTAFHELGPAEYPFGRADLPAGPAPAWKVLGTRGCGSVLVEAALTLAEIAYDREEVDYEHPGPGRDRLRAVNPLGQVPAVILPDGAVMTESAAIVMYIDELVPAAGLLPRPGDPLRRDALRWLIFLVAAVYPTFTYGDDPAKWVGDAGPRLRDATEAHRQSLWRQVEASVRGPWLLGARFSILDAYVAVMTHWRPRRAWFAEHCPKLAAIAAAADREPRLRALWAASF
ncbi:MAG TPA: cupin domain-containing protein [Kofleriaceae bacterium]|nr:cupin domain-containing protein [Kofleriaceae bacterium]